MRRWGGSRGRIHKHLVEAEKSTFQGELSFQRSWCTAGITVTTIFVLIKKKFLLIHMRKTLIILMTLHLRFIFKRFAHRFGSLALTLSDQPSFQNV